MYAPWRGFCRLRRAMLENGLCISRLGKDKLGCE